MLETLTDGAIVYMMEHLPKEALMAKMVLNYLFPLKRRFGGLQMKTVIDHPTFQLAMEDVQVKLRTGTATWHSYDEVFGQ